MADTRRLVRLYPIPLRYMDAESVFRKYQWIEADIYKDTDPRPESYKIRPDTIQTFDQIPTEQGNWDRRAEWVLAQGNVFRSVEDLQQAQQSAGTSLGLVRPVEILGYTSEPVPEAEQDHFRRRLDALRHEGDLFDLDPSTSVRPLSPPDFRFRIRFRCDDPNCTSPHEFGVLDWEVDALYARLRSKGRGKAEARQEVQDHLCKLLDPAKKDTHFFLGNMLSHQHNFTIVGLWYPKKGAVVAASSPRHRAARSVRPKAPQEGPSLFDSITD
jgi:hypothetical protein